MAEIEEMVPHPSSSDEGSNQESFAWRHGVGADDETVDSLAAKLPFGAASRLILLLLKCCPFYPRCVMWSLVQSHTETYEWEDL